jgi:hypothetical protein
MKPSYQSKAVDEFIGGFRDDAQKAPRRIRAIGIAAAGAEKVIRSRVFRTVF